MKYTQALVVSAPSCLLAYFAGTLLVTCVLAIPAIFYDPVGFFSGFGVVAFVALTIGFLPMCAFGIPAYAGLYAKGWATYLSCAALGFAPALLLLLIHQSMWVLFAIYGPPVALLSHFFSTRRASQSAL
jgi:hypothetical protein